MKKKIISVIGALLIATPAFAWPQITVTAPYGTDPVFLISAVFTGPGIPTTVQTLNMPGLPGWFRTFGPLPQVGPCPAYRTVEIIFENKQGWIYSQAAVAKMDVCHESHIYVTGGPGGTGAGTAPLVVTHSN